jgi:hypothetical protein
MTQRHENLERHQPVERRHEFSEHQHIHPSHSDFQHHHQSHRHIQQSHEKHLVDKGQLPDFHLTHNGDVQASNNKPGATAEGTKPAAENSAAGEVKFSNLRGAAVDTDGSGAHRHTEDRSRQNQTSLRDGNGKSLDTDKDNFVALPKKEMQRMGIHLGDHGYLQRQDTGEKVPVVFGDASSGKEWKHGNGQTEASVAALKGLGFNNVDGRHGVDKNVQFNLIMQPGSRDKGLNA